MTESLNSSTNIPLEYTTHCWDLLRAHERAYMDYQQQQINPSLLKNGFANGPYIDWKGSMYDSRKNTCQGNCLWDATKAHQKCKCLQLYAPGRQHLVAPCDASNSSGPPLTFDQCKSLGYLNDLDPETTSHSTTQSLTPTSSSIIWPQITCENCRESFEALQHNYTTFTYQQVVNCIRRMQNNNNPHSKKSFIYVWYGIGLLLLLVLCGFIAYRIYKGALCNSNNRNRSSSSTCPPCPPCERT
ncbi:MAG: hypothetical protein Sylvanvirus4_17 [Sylvanvirus sp.]|uniref:Uncharacterized protein n=1 Tax=Sylvanvirus sp. TaxID=2487774 RepID=A0A3G5AK90_9VIRU|nr:MAG: hypothetical protein Sylvanvirus4_17 [Sylvanvirus sp.]